MDQGLGERVAARGILVNAGARGDRHGDASRQMERRAVDLLISKIPRGRVGKPEEVAALVAWLASGECSFGTEAVYDLSAGRATYEETGVPGALAH